MDSRSECVTTEGLGHVLCCAWKGDNAGPHSAEEVRPACCGIHMGCGGLTWCPLPNGLRDDDAKQLRLAVASPVGRGGGG